MSNIEIRHGSESPACRSQPNGNRRLRRFHRFYWDAINTCPKTICVICEICGSRFPRGAGVACNPALNHAKLLKLWILPNPFRCRSSCIFVSLRAYPGSFSGCCIRRLRRVSAADFSVGLFFRFGFHRRGRVKASASHVSSAPSTTASAARGIHSSTPTRARVSSSRNAPPGVQFDT